MPFEIMRENLLVDIPSMETVLRLSRSRRAHEEIADFNSHIAYLEHLLYEQSLPTQPVTFIWKAFP